jgi:hypothetical protein
LFLAYDNLIFDVLHLEEWVREAVYDESKKDFLWWHHSVTAACILNVEATAASRFPPIRFTGVTGEVSARFPPPGPGEKAEQDSRLIKQAPDHSLFSAGLEALKLLMVGPIPVGPLIQLGAGLAGLGPIGAAAGGAAGAVAGGAAGATAGVAAGAIFGAAGISAVPNPSGPGGRDPAGTNRPAGSPGQVRGTGYPQAPFRGDLDAMLRPGQTRQQFFEEIDRLVGPTPGSDLETLQNNGLGGLFEGFENRPPGRPPRPAGRRPFAPDPQAVQELDILSGVRPGILSNRPTVPWTDVEIRERLRRPRRQLMVWLNSGPDGDAEFMLLSPYPGMDLDAQGGPLCTILELPEVHGVQTAVLRLKFDTWEAAPPTTSPLGVPALVSNRWNMGFGWNPESHLRTQTVSGTAVFRLDCLALNRLTADQLRQQMWHPIPAGYRREIKKVEQNPGGDAIEYEFEDTEVIMNNPGGAEYGIIHLEADQEMSFTGYDSPSEAA